MKKQLNIKKFLPILYILIFFFINITFLTAFPFIHSDEAWLGGLSRNMLLNESLTVTEPFFDLKVRHPHAIKSVFHLLQQIFIYFGGYNIFTLRFLSLVTGCVSLFVFYLCAKNFLKSKFSAFLAMVFMSVNVQFIYASHFARNDIFILLGICLCMYIISLNDFSSKNVVLMCITTGVCIFIHPNSFLVGCMCVVVFAFHTYRTKSFKSLTLYVLLTGLFAAVAVAISFYMDDNFIKNYFSYGNADFDILAPVSSKMSGLGGFISRLISQNSGTYYLPYIVPEFIIFAVSIAVCLFFVLVMHREKDELSQKISTLIFAFIGIIGGVTAIGRFNQTSIVFVMLPLWLIVAIAVKIIADERAVFLHGLLIVILLISSIVQIAPWIKADGYSQYLLIIQRHVPSDAKVIGNLNTGFYFNNDSLHDYRNLPFLKDKEHLQKYIEQHQIEYIIYSDELNFIYENRPYYNVIYGNIMFKEFLQQFCEENCTLVGEFFDDLYGVRIISLLNNGEYGNVKIYNVN